MAGFSVRLGKWEHEGQVKETVTAWLSGGERIKATPRRRSGCGARPRSGGPQAHSCRPDARPGLLT